MLMENKTPEERRELSNVLLRSSGWRSMVDDDGDEFIAPPWWNGDEEAAQEAEEMRAWMREVNRR